MKARWINSPYDGEPDENGDYVLVIENNAGNRVSTFKGKTERDIIEQLLRSQVQANRQIGRLMKPDEGKKPSIENKEFSPSDKFRLATEITDPEKVVDTVTEIMSARQADTPVGKMLTQQERDRHYYAEAMAFMAEVPEYYPCDANKILLTNELARRKIDLTRNNLALVFYDIEDQLQPWPDEPGDGEADNPPAAMQSAPEPPRYRPEPEMPPTPQPVRNYSTTLRSSDSTASKPMPRKRPVVTRQELERMSRADMKERLLHDPAFKQAVDALA
jgi:hypothetical protein